jgi:hypothetical protein
LEVDFKIGNTTEYAWAPGLQAYKTDGVTTQYLSLQPDGGGVAIGSEDVATASLMLPAGTTTASTAPLKFTTGTSLTTPEAGAVEFTTDNLYFTITTGAARKQITLDEGLTATRVPYSTTNGRLTDAATLTFDGTALTVNSATVSSITIANWNTAYGWGDHSGEGYLTAESDTLDSVTGRNASTANAVTVGSATISDLTSGRVPYASTAGLLIDNAGFLFDGTTLTAEKVSVNTSGQSIFVSTRYGANSAGFNIWIGSGGESSIGAVAETWKGSKNVAIGVLALQAVTTGYYNMAIGTNALQKTTTGSANVAIGVESLTNNTGGYGNLSFGTSTMYLNTTGYENIAIGAQALYNNVGGYANVGIGNYALRGCTSGYQNTAIGTSALYNITTTNGNVALGAGAGFRETGANKLFIDNSARTSEAQARTTALVYGVFAAAAIDQDFTINGQVGVNIPPTAWLTLPAGTATAGTAPLKFTSGTLTTAAVAGQMEYLSGSFYIRGTDIWNVASKVAVPEIKTDTTTPTDLTITTGAAKTLVLATSVYDDLQFPISTGKVPIANFPNWEAFTTNTAAYAFDVDELIDLQCDEIFHQWKEGTTGHVHIHFSPKTAQATGTDRFVKFTVLIAYADVDEVWSEHAAFTAEYTIPTGTDALKHLYLDLGDMTLTNNLIGTQLKARVKRIAATGGTEYADDVFITQVGMHLEKIRIGTRAEKTA